MRRSLNCHVTGGGGGDSLLFFFKQYRERNSLEVFPLLAGQNERFGDVVSTLGTCDE